MDSIQLDSLFWNPTSFISASRRYYQMFFPWLPRSNTEKTLSTFFSSCARRNYHGTSIPPAEVASKRATSCKMGNTHQGGREHLPKSKQAFYKRSNTVEFEAPLQSLENELITALMEFEAPLQSLENELITALMAKIDNEEMKQVFLGAPQLHHFCPYGERNSDIMTLSHINKPGLKRPGLGFSLWHGCAGQLPALSHQEPHTDELSLPSSLRTQVIRLYLLSQEAS